MTERYKRTGDRYVDGDRHQRLREYARSALIGLLASGAPPVKSTVTLAFSLGAMMLAEELDDE